MPNFCSNLLTISQHPGRLKADAAAVIASLRGPNGPLDFETILPIPVPLKNIHRGGQHIDGEYHTHWRNEPLHGGRVKWLPIPESELARYRKDYGADNPLMWCAHHWGTKWNADCHDFDWDRLSIRFDTAWNPPHAFVAALSKVHPSFRFELRFVEPDEGMNGCAVYARGELQLSQSFSPNSEQGFTNGLLVRNTLAQSDEIPQTH